jgi:hypothetical protein
MKDKYIYKTNYDRFRYIANSEISNSHIQNVDVLIEKIQIAKNMSTEKIKIRTRNNEWITPYIYDKMKCRKKAYDTYKKDPNNTYKKEKYIKMKKMVEDLLKEEKSKVISNNIEKAGSNSRKVWKVIKNALSNKG